MNLSARTLALPVIVALAAAAAFYQWHDGREDPAMRGLISGNGRIEATEIDIATKLAGRLDDVLVKEGDFVTRGQPLARMQISTLEAQRNEVLAQQAQAQAAVASAEAQVAMRRSDVATLNAVKVQRQTDLDTARNRLRRSEKLANEGSLSHQLLEDSQAAVRSAEAALKAALAQIRAGDAAITAALAQVKGAEAAVAALSATLDRIDHEIADSQLIAPRDGRVQFMVTQPGEVLGAGGKVLNMVDLTDVYMTFFLPETVAGRIALGSDVRLVLDAAPGYVIPAEVSFVASTAQFTPKTVETESERQKLMFRVRARIAPELLKAHITQVKTGLPGVAWLKTEADATWPPSLQVNVRADNAGE